VVGSSAFAAADEATAAAVTAVTADDVVGCEGGGIVSMFVVTDVGSASSGRRKPVVMKSRCFCEAVKFVRMSECSSDCWVILRA